ncbi:hypothetical protein ACFW38_000144 [Salmonella enterica]
MLTALMQPHVPLMAVFMLRPVVKSPQLREPKSISGKSPAQRKLHHYNVQHIVVEQEWRLAGKEIL